LAKNATVPNEIKPNAMAGEKTSNQRPSNRIYPLRNPVQAYPWGSKTAIQSLLGQPVPSDTPAAELWLGAHPKAPSSVRMGDTWVPVDQFIKMDPVAILGRPVAEKYDGQLPFLMKVLAADRPLSIQVHPNQEQALKGFERENRSGVPLDAPERNYRDTRHKPECLCALTPFEALKGFRPVEKILAFMKPLSLRFIPDALRGLGDAPDAPGLKRFFSMLMSMAEGRRAREVEAAVRQAGSVLGDIREVFWMKELNRQYPGDVGVLAPLLLNLIRLAPEEAIYISAGEPHAYLEGVGVEIMASSDNVIRGGLTPKPVDLPELLRLIDVRPGHPLRVDVRDTGKERIYLTPAAEFSLSRLSISPDETYNSAEQHRVEILLCMEGDAAVIDVGNTKTIPMPQGASVIIPASVPKYQIEGKATIFRAAVAA
jgi:mannose-6-phosphate isomerase